MLAEHHVEFERRDYFKEPFTEPELRSLFAQIGIRPGDVVSKRSKAYKDLGLSDRDASDDELIALMIAHPTLLRRPIIVDDGDAVVGFDQERIEALIEKR